MTRNEFLQNITSWSELKGFCSDYQCECCDDIYDEYEMDEEVDSDVYNYCRDYPWRTLSELLRNIPQGCEYYRKRSAFYWEEADNEMFERYKSEVCEWADDNDMWDDDYEEDEEDIFEEAEDDFFAEESDETPVDDEDFSVGDLIGMCSVAFVAIQKDNMRKIQEDKKAFEQFVDVNVPKVLK